MWKLAVIADLRATTNFMSRRHVVHRIMLPFPPGLAARCAAWASKNVLRVRIGLFGCECVNGQSRDPHVYAKDLTRVRLLIKLFIGQVFEGGRDVERGCAGASNGAARRFARGDAHARDELSLG